MHTKRYFSVSIKKKHILKKKKFLEQNQRNKTQTIPKGPFYFLGFI